MIDESCFLLRAKRFFNTMHHHYLKGQIGQYNRIPVSRLSDHIPNHQNIVTIVLRCLIKRTAHKWTVRRELPRLTMLFEHNYNLSRPWYHRCPLRWSLRRISAQLPLTLPFSPYGCSEVRDGHRAKHGTRQSQTSLSKSCSGFTNNPGRARCKRQYNAAICSYIGL